MRWGLSLSRTAATMEVTAPWPFCTCAILVKSDVSTFLLTMTRLFLTPSCSHISFPKMKKLLLTQVFPSLTFSLSICHEACLSAACTYHTLSKLRCLPILPDYPSSFPYLTLPAAPKNNTLPDAPAPKGAFSTLLPYRAAAHSFPPHPCPYKIGSFFSGDRKKN